MVRRGVKPDLAMRGKHEQCDAGRPEPDLCDSVICGVIRLPLYARRTRAGGQREPNIRVVSDRPLATMTKPAMSPAI
jgi:hypothetical protein